MIRTLTYRLMIKVAVLLLAITSVSSASRLAPVDMAQDQIATFLAVGGSIDDLCDDTPNHNHAEHCPFCNTVGEAIRIAPTGRVWTLFPESGNHFLVAVTFGDQQLMHHRFARGPPVTT